MLSYLTNKYIKKEFYVRNNSRLGTDGPTKIDEFLEKFQGGGSISNQKNYVADFCHYKRFLGHVFRKKSAT